MSEIGIVREVERVIVRSDGDHISGALYQNVEEPRKFYITVGGSRFVKLNENNTIQAEESIPGCAIKNYNLFYEEEKFSWCTGMSSVVRHQKAFEYLAKRARTLDVQLHAKSWD